MSEVGVEKLEGKEAPDLPLKEGFFDGEVSPGVAKKKRRGRFEQGVDDQDGDVNDEQPLGDRGSFERAGHAGWPAGAVAPARLHVVAIRISHTEGVAVFALS